MKFAKELTERFLRYVAIPSESNGRAGVVPSSEGQRELARLLEVAEKKYWPKKKALLALLRKGYGREEILGAMERADYRDDRISRLLLEAKLPPDATDEEKDLLLARRGFRQE